jgi:hypothetical protein
MDIILMELGLLVGVVVFFAATFGMIRVIERL